MEKKEWKNCPNCGGYIPKNWGKHTKCGWGVEDEETEPESPENSQKAELNVELLGTRITVTRRETRQVRDFENNSYTVSITKPVEEVDENNIRELQELTKTLIAEQKKDDGVGSD